MVSGCAIRRVDNYIYRSEPSSALPNTRRRAEYVVDRKPPQAFIWATAGDDRVAVAGRSNAGLSQFEIAALDLIEKA